MTRLGAALLLTLALACAALAQSAQDVGRMAGFAEAFNGLVGRALGYGAELSAADNRLSDAIDGYAALAPAIAQAEEALALAPRRGDDLARLAAALERPALDTPKLVQVLDALEGLPEKIVAVYRADAAILADRLDLARTDPGDTAGNAELDAAFARNALIQIEAENAMLEVAISVIDPAHPQHGLSSAYLASNKAGLPIFRMSDPSDPPTPEDAAALADELRALADEADAALDRMEAALGRWRLRSLIDRQVRRLVPLFDASVPTEREIAGTLRELAGLMDTQIAAGTYEPAAFEALDARMQALIARRTEEAQDRVAAIRRLAE